MKLVDLNLWDGSRVVYNALYATKDIRFLTHDLLLAKLPDGTSVDVSWSPELDADGHYDITVYRDNWDDVINVIPANSPDEVVRIVESLSREAARPARAVSNESH